MPRYYYDNSLNKKVGIDAVVPITLGGTGATSSFDASINLSFIPRTTINQPHGPIGLDGDGFFNNSLYLGQRTVNGGGTAASTPQEAEQQLNFIPVSLLDQPSGVPILDTDGYVPTRYLPEINTHSVSVEGSTEVYINEEKVYTITDYDSTTPYTVTTNNGTVTQVGDKITFKPTDPNSNEGFKVNGRVIPVTILKGMVEAPTIITPIHNSISNTLTQTVIASPFAFKGVPQTHLKSRWELATDFNFTNQVDYYEGTDYLTQWTPIPLNGDTQYFLRVKYQGSDLSWSEWSAPCEFKTFNTRRWVVKVTGTEHEELYDVAIDSQNYIYVVGNETTTDSTGAVFLSKWDDDGQFIWARRLAGPGLDVSFSLAIDSKDNVYVAGYEASTDITHYDCFLSKFSSSGLVLWQRRIGGMEFDYFYNVAVDHNDDIYACGFERSYGDHRRHAFLTKWNGTGQLLWQQNLMSTDQLYFYSIAFDQQNHVYVAGEIVNTGGFITKWDQYGHLMWQKRLDVTDNSSFREVYVDQNNILYVTGSNYIVKADIDFNILKVIKLENPYYLNYGLRVDSSGNIYVTDANNMAIIKLNSSGQLVWYYSITANFSNTFQDIELSRDGFIYAVGHESKTTNRMEGIIAKIPMNGDIPVGAFTGAGMTQLGWTTLTLNPTIVTPPTINTQFFSVSPDLPVGEPALTVTNMYLDTFKTNY